MTDFTYKELTFHRVDNGRVEAGNGWLTLAYWPRHIDPTWAKPQDEWTYETILEGAVCPVSHPNEEGCWIGIRKALIEAGVISIPFDNSHLDEKDSAIHAETFRNYDKRAGVRNGDFLDMGNGTMNRACHLWEHGAQVTLGGSFSISKLGGVQYSGSLDPVILFERWEPTGETKPGRFWFFSHGISGAGRGVDVWHPCRVFQLVDITMTEAEARAHPAAKDCGEFWGDGHREHLARISGLMIGQY